MLLGRQAGGRRLMVVRVAVHPPQLAITATHTKQGPLSPTNTHAQGAAWGQSDSKQSQTETLQCATPYEGAKSFHAFKSMSDNF